jgi:hypothetical protein
MCPPRRIERIHEQITAMELLAQGTLTKRTKVCGRPNCRCAHDPKSRHGPYYEWTRRIKGRYVHSILSAEQAAQLSVAIENNRKLRILLTRWTKETTSILKM